MSLARVRLWWSFAAVAVAAAVVHHHPCNAFATYEVDGSGSASPFTQEALSGPNAAAYHRRLDSQQAIQGFSEDTLLFWRQEHEFALVADLDKASRDPEKFLWRSILKTGTLLRSADDKFTVTWRSEIPIESRTAMNNRSMELSALVRYRHLLLAMCDITGMVFKIQPNGKVFQRWAVADGNGEEPKPFKIEWATVKDGLLWVGSIGREWTWENGTIGHRNAEWVKTIDVNGHIDNYDWGPVYLALRTAANASHPGYLWHEAAHWDAYNRLWVFAPRKASTDVPYSPEVDETQGSNFLITANEGFTDIRVVTVGDLEPAYGFSSIRKIPGTPDLYLGIKSMEIGQETHSKLVVFDLQGNLRSDWIDIADKKFEGVEFVHGASGW